MPMSQYQTFTAFAIFQRMWSVPLLAFLPNWIYCSWTDTRPETCLSLSLSLFSRFSPQKVGKGEPPKLSRGLSPSSFLCPSEEEKKPQIRACVSRPKIEGPPIPTYWASVHQVLLQLLSGDVTIKFSTIITSNLQFETNCDQF